MDRGAGWATVYGVAELDRKKGGARELLAKREKGLVLDQAISSWRGGRREWHGC